MTWRNPLFTPSSAVTGVRIAARSKSVKHDAMAVHLSLGRDLMTKLGFKVGEKVRLWVGDGPNAGWVRLTLPAGMDGTTLKIGTGGGGSRLAGGLVQFSARYLQGAAMVEKMTAIDAEYRIDRDALDIRLPDWWVAAASNASAKRDKAAAIEAPKLYTPPAEPQPTPKPAPAGPMKFATASPPPVGRGEREPKRILWTDAEVATLRRLWAAGASDNALLAALPKRPWGAIAYKANSLGLGVRPIIEKRGPDVATPKRPSPKPRVAVHAPATADKPVKRVATVVEERRPLARRPAGAAAPKEDLGSGTTIIHAAAWMRAQGVSVVLVPTRGTIVANGQDMTPRQFVAYANSERIKRNLPATFTADDRTDRITASGSGGSSLTNMGA